MSTPEDRLTAEYKVLDWTSFTLAILTMGGILLKAPGFLLGDASWWLGGVLPIGLLCVLLFVATRSLEVALFWALLVFYVLVRSLINRG